MSETVGSGGLVLAGTLTEREVGTVTSTYSISELSTTTEKESSSGTAAASAAGSSDQTTLSGTLTDTLTLSAPSTLTETDGGNETVTVSDVVSGGIESSSLYETGSDSQSDTQAGTLISTQISSYDQNNAGASSSGSLTTSATLTETAMTVSGGPTTETEAETQTLGTLAIVSGGNLATTLWTNGDEYYSLYESGNETYSTGTNQSQGGVTGFNLSSGYTGTGLSTLTVTASSTFSSTETATTTLGSNATIAGGSFNDSLFETGTDNTSSNGAGIQIHQFTNTGNNSDSGSFTLAFSQLDTDPSTFTETATEGQTLGVNGAVVSGQELDTLTSYGTGSQYFYDQGERLVTLQGGSGYYDDGDYAYGDNTSESYTEANYYSEGLGANGTISGGTESLGSTDLYTDSNSYEEIGGEVFPDPVYGTSIPGTLTQISVSTSYVYSVNQGGPSLGVAGTVTGGVNSFTYIQTDSDSYSTTMGDDPLYVLTESDASTLSEDMLGSESYGTGGTIAGGADSFTWTQGANDNYDFGLFYIPDTLSYTTYVMNVDDYVVDALSDSGTDQLGASDSITGDSDIYDIYSNHDLSSGIVDLGSSQSPNFVSASGWDDVTSTDLGSSTLTNGRTYATDTEGYTEFSGSTATDHESSDSGSTNVFVSGDAYESYYNANESSITNNTGSMTTAGSYAMNDSHSVSGYESIVGGGLNAAESGTDEAYMNAAGGSDTYGNCMSYTQCDSGGDVFLFSTGAETGFDSGYTISGGMTQASVNYSQGSQESGPGGSSSNSYVSTSMGSENGASGEQWFPVTIGDSGNFLVTVSFADIGFGSSSSDVLAYTVSGSPATVTTLINSSSTSESGTFGSGFGEPTTYHAVLAGSSDATQIGRFEPGAMQFGDDEQSLDTTSGLYSGLGGEDVSGLEFTGNEEQVIAIQGPTTIYNYGGPNSRSAWQAQPASSGYVRGNQTSGSGTSEADFDSGTPDGTPAEELENVENFDGGSPQNPSADQPAPTSRAQQNAGSTESGSEGTSASDTTASHISTEGIVIPGGGGGGSSSGGTLVGGGEGGFWGQFPQFLSGNATPVGPGLDNLPNYGKLGSGTRVAGQLGLNGGFDGKGQTGQQQAQDHGTTQGGPSGGRGGPGEYSTANAPQASPPPATPGNPGSSPTASPDQSPLNGGVPAPGSQTPTPGLGSNPPDSQSQTPPSQPPADDGGDDIIGGDDDPNGGLSWDDTEGNGDRSPSSTQPPSIGAPGFFESLIPFWGNGREMVNAYQNGNHIMTGVGALGLITDLIPGKAIAGAVGKGVVKGVTAVAQPLWNAAKGGLSFAKQGLGKLFGTIAAKEAPAVAKAVAPKAIPQTLKGVDLPGRIRAAGSNLAETGEFFGWKPSQVIKGIDDFTKEQLLAKGWTKERLLDVAEGYEHIARITPANPSAAGRAAQLRELATLFD